MKLIQGVTQPKLFKQLIKHSCPCRFCSVDIRAYTINDAKDAFERSEPVKLAYNIYDGSDSSYHDSKSLVILHGLYGSKAGLHSLAKQLHKKLNRKIIVPDLRNHADSPRSPKMDYFHLAKDIATLIQDLNQQDVDLFGHSFAGRIAMTLALVKPELINSLLIGDTSAGPKVNTPKLQVDKRAAAIMLKFLKEHIDCNEEISEIRNKLTAALSDAIPQGRAMASFFSRGLIKINNGASLGYQFELEPINSHIESYYVFPILDGSFQKATIFIAGDRASYIGPDKLPKMKELFPAHVVRRIPGAGHWFHFEKPDLFVDTVHDFLNGRQ